MTRTTRFKYDDEIAITKERIIEVVEVETVERVATHTISGIEHEIASLDLQIARIEARKQKWVDLKQQLMVELAVDEEMLERPMREPDEELVEEELEPAVPGDEPIRSEGGR